MQFACLPPSSSYLLSVLPAFSDPYSLIFSLKQSHFSSSEYSTLHRSTAIYPDIVSLFKSQVWALVWNSSVTSGHWLFPLAETELNFHVTWEASKEWDFPCTHICGLHHQTGKWQPCLWQWTGLWWDLRFLSTQTILWFYDCRLFT